MVSAIQKIGKDFWRTLRFFNPCEYIEELGVRTDLIIFKPKDDDVIENKYFDEYKEIENINYVEVDGDHNFTDLVDRKNIFEQIKRFLLK